MSATVRGLLIFIGLVVFVALACVGPAFFWLPNAGNGVGLPVITMPAEIIAPRAFLGGLDITNTLTSLILVDLILIVIAVVVGRALRTAPPDRYVPRGFSNFIEMIGEFLYNQAHNLLGAKYTRWAFPIAATIFLFLLTANLSKLIPGFESVGIVACAEYNAAAPDTDPIAAGQNGYPVKGLSASDPARARSCRCSSMVRVIRPMPPMGKMIPLNWANALGARPPALIPSNAKRLTHGQSLLSPRRMKTFL